jgi:hypothetical protein
MFQTKVAEKAKTHILCSINFFSPIGLEETIIKEIEQNQLTWYGHV